MAVCAPKSKDKTLQEHTVSPIRLSAKYEKVAEVNRIKRGKNQSEIQMEVILDIGADLSCLPIASDSTSVKGPSAGRIAVRDA
ncbi:hypothetical protein AK812_SmicGene40755 [Symbiodinium microadriaticum]|uniref:Peptidase A2 domain-containing protein n=1 Tax=Symbiodinium microadriaticum TaxID=2951 RepID=A0A1Q9C7V8_SYMMI|nr:hypothetical protein AK812_SmicGene40755 [Symbiodinium microadriaticum]